jgi:hypothetical protein
MAPNKKLGDFRAVFDGWEDSEALFGHPGGWRRMKILLLIEIEMFG